MKLAKKYHVSRNMIARHSSAEGWTEERKNAKAEIQQRVTQRTAELVADNATLLEQIKTTLLRKLAKMAEAYPENGAGEMRKKEADGTELIYRMRDIAAVYESLSEKTIRASIDMEDLSPLAELLRDE